MMIVYLPDSENHFRFTENRSDELKVQGSVLIMIFSVHNKEESSMTVHILKWLLLDASEDFAYSSISK